MNSGAVPRAMTIKDVARLAGVSPATVSNVLNGTGRASKTTIERVTEIIRQHNFNVNASARTLRQKSSRIIGVLVPLADHGSFDFNPFYWHFVDGVMQVTQKCGYDVILKAVSDETQFNVVQERDLDGVVVVGAYEHLPLTQMVLGSGIPSVFVDSYIPGSKVNSVTLDDRFGSYLATRHLIGLGHSKILYISGALVENGVEYRRFEGYRQAMDEGGLSSLMETLQTDIALEAGQMLAHQLAYRMNGFTGIVTTADTLAMGLIRGFKDCGIGVPQRVSIVGFDDIAQSGFTIPSITTIHQDVIEKGKCAGTMILELMERTGDGKVKTVQLSPKLIIRESTAPPSEG